MLSDTSQARSRFLLKLPFFISFVLKLYLAGIVIFGVLRLILLLYVADESIQLFNSITLKSFLVGLEFDSVILAFVLAIPLLLLYIQSLFQIQKKHIPIFVTVYLCMVFPVLIFLTISDIPYFKFFHNRLTESSMQWLGSLDIVLKMVLGNTINFLFFIAALLATFSAGFALLKFCGSKLIKHNSKSDNPRFHKLYQSIFLLLFMPVCFLGMHGTTAHPIRQGDAFYCNNPILNQVGLNPIFTLMKSYGDKVNLINNKIAIKNTLQLLQIKSPVESISPIARVVKNDSLMKKHNVVLILMEGMSANFMKTFGNTNNLTPTLDSLAKASLFFNNAYSAGIHTNNGVFSSLFSFPALKRVRPMSTVPARTFSGLPYTLKQNGYKNLFFCTHAGSFDNIGAFIPHNFFDELYTADDFPADKIIGPFGVPDDYLFSTTINKLCKISPEQPFFATILTASNHDPYIIPEYYKSTLTDKEQRAVSYADWSIHKFLADAKKCDWFDNTIFVFVSDHGRTVGENPYDLALSYNHVPIIMFAPAILGEPKVCGNFMGQIDIFPTIMGLLNASYINNTLGVDALSQKRECIYFSADTKIGCIDNEWLYVYRFDGGESLYQYKTGNTEDFSLTRKSEFEKLKKYALSQTQVSEWMIANDKTSLLKKH